VPLLLRSNIAYKFLETRGVFVNRIEHVLWQRPTVECTPPLAIQIPQSTREY
jgi:hypothetical protein